MKSLAALFVVVLVQTIVVGQSTDESKEKQKMCGMVAASALNTMMHTFSATDIPKGTAASIYGSRYSAEDSTCYAAMQYQVTDNNRRNCSFLTLIRVSFAPDPDRRPTKAAEIGWCPSNGSAQSEYMSTSPSDICRGGGSKESDYSCVRAFIKNSVEAKK